jgi:hypothetical protein
MKTAIIDTPAKERVIAALERYKQTDADLQDYWATSSKAEVEEQKGLDDPKLTEQEAADKISRAQNLKSVYASRIKHREAALGKEEKALMSVRVTAAGELTGLVHREHQKREALFRKRVLAAGEYPQDAPVTHGLDLLFGASPLRRAIIECEPRNYAILRLKAPLIAEELIGLFDRFEAEVEKDV